MTSRFSFGSRRKRSRLDLRLRATSRLTSTFYFFFNNKSLKEINFFKILFIIFIKLCKKKFKTIIISFLPLLLSHNILSNAFC